MGDGTYVSQEIILLMVVFLDRCCLLFLELLDGRLELAMADHGHIDFAVLDTIVVVCKTPHCDNDGRNSLLMFR